LSTVRAQVALSAYTTLGLGGPAGRLIEAENDEQIVSAIQEADRAGEPVLVLGGGSNLVVADEGFPGLVLRLASRGIVIGRDIAIGQADGDAGRQAEGDDGGQAEGAAGAVTVNVAAGESWDELVEWSVQEGLAGLECLSGIPGLVGATPIQNVGAYGQDVSQTITAVRVLDRERGQIAVLTAAQCEFGYRTSMLKRTAAGKATGRFVVLGVSFRLGPQPRPQLDAGLTSSGVPLSAPIRYNELAARLGVAPGERAPLAQVRAAVLTLRRGKGMVLDAADPDTRSAGSFFTNPVLTAAQFAELKRRVAIRCGPDVPVPHYPVSEAVDLAAVGPGAVKVPAAWLIEQAGFAKGYPADGAARISTKHTLALTHPGGGNTASLLALAREITAGVQAAFGVKLANEPVLVGVAL
jgi:UDP-N-acetylmuramate dehydrogenase